MTATPVPSCYRESLERAAEYERQRLINSARGIAENMATLATRLEANPDLSVNDLGELQGRGPSLDVNCAKYHAARKTLRDFDAFSKGA